MLPLTPALKTLVVCASVLLLNIYALGMYVGALRGRAGLAINPEDGDGSQRLVTAELPEDVARASRAHRNAVENIPGFLALAILAVGVGCAPVPLVACLMTFTAARLAHSIFYLHAMQPWRSASYGMASASQIAVMVLLAIKVFGSG